MKAPSTPTTPSLEAGSPTRNALLKIAKILKRVDKLPVPTPVSSQEDTEIPRLKATKERFLNPTPTPTSNIQALTPRLGASISSPTQVPTPSPIYSNVTDKWKKSVQRLPQTRYNLCSRPTSFKQ